MNEGAFDPPADRPIFRAAEALITIGSAGAVFVAIAIAIRYWRTAGSAVPFFLLVGAGIAIMNEPLVDILGKCFHNGAARWRIFELFGRPIPAWGLFGYVIVYGVTAWCILTTMRQGAGRASFWTVIGAMCLIQVAMEMVILPTNLYYYFGYQPWSFFGMPLFWLAINFAGTTLTAAVLTVTWRYWTGYRQVLVLLLPAATQVLGSYFIGLPVFAALHSDAPNFMIWFAGGLSLALALVVIDILGTISRRSIRLASTADSPSGGLAHPD